MYRIFGTFLLCFTEIPLIFCSWHPENKETVPVVPYFSRLPWDNAV
jgi:hypothetical protein